MDLQEYQVALREDIESERNKLEDDFYFSKEIIGKISPKTKPNQTDIGLASSLQLKSIKLKDLIEWHNLFFNQEELNEFLEKFYEDVKKGHSYFKVAIQKGPSIWLPSITEYDPFKNPNIETYIRNFITENAKEKRNKQRIKNMLSVVTNYIADNKLSLGKEVLRYMEESFNNVLFNSTLIEHYERLFGSDEELASLNRGYQKEIDEIEWAVIK